MVTDPHLYQYAHARSAPSTGLLNINYYLITLNTSTNLMLYGPLHHRLYSKLL